MGNGNGIIEKFNKLSTLCKAVAAIVTTFVVIGGAVIAFESRYATADDVKNLRIETVQTFDKFHEKIQEQFKDHAEQRKQDKLQMEYDYAVRRMYDLKDQMRKNPNDQELKRDYEEARQLVKELKARLSGN